MLDGVRRRYYRTRAAEPLRVLLGRAAPPPSTPIAEAPLLALDLELTGLDPRRAEVISVGFVPVEGLRLRLDRAERHLVRPQGTVEGSAHVHHLTDAELVQAGPLSPAIEATLRALAGRALLVHHARLDFAILCRICRELYGGPLIVPIVDTLALAYRAATRGDRMPEQGSLRLPALRAKYGLPVAKLHGALSDAAATAELFLAMAAERGPRARLGDFLSAR